MKVENFTIRDYKPEDYSAIMHLWQETGLNTPGRGDNEKTIEKTISIGGKLLVMLYKEKKNIIGSSWLTSDGRRLYLHHFGIIPEYQGMMDSKSMLLNYTIILNQGRAYL